MSIRDTNYIFKPLPVCEVLQCVNICFINCNYKFLFDLLQYIMDIAVHEFSNAMNGLTKTSICSKGFDTYFIQSYSIISFIPFRGRFAHFCFLV